jgi:hypothetical protein
MTKKPWRNKGKSPKGVGHLATAPGQMMSVDHLESSAAGFISQLKGKLTRRRYKAATIFVDNFSRMSYFHLQESLTSADTVEAKEAFEAFSRNMGVMIQHYHADNGIFVDNGLMNAVKKKQQTISFCGVNAHFQNGIAEKRIRDLQEQACTMLLHAKSRWPKRVSIHLWPYALRSANQLRQVGKILWSRIGSKSEGLSHSFMPSICTQQFTGQWEIHYQVGQQVQDGDQPGTITKTRKKCVSGAQPYNGIVVTTVSCET